MNAGPLVEFNLIQQHSVPNSSLLSQSEKASSIEYFHRKCETQARVLPTQAEEGCKR